MKGIPTAVPDGSPRQDLPLCLLLAGVFVLAQLGPPAAAAAESGQGKILPGTVTSSRVCGGCHTDIYNAWKNSLHAFALSDPIFDTAFMQALKSEGDRARRICLRCHAPLVMVNGDFELNEGVTREGVSCDFCHSVTDVHTDGRPDPYVLEVGLVKRSVLRKAESPAHEVAYSALHETAQFCGGCHSYYAANGVAIMGTYDEWKAGPYAQAGVPCQSCHMVLSRGRVVREDLKKTGSEIHLHDLIHDRDQLRSALTVKIDSAQRTPSEIRFVVEVENVGSGHMVPTGLPSREVVLTVQVEGGGRVQKQERRYRKVVADADRNPLSSDADILLYGATILSDNRIRPKEVRKEVFSFPLLRTELRAVASAKLSYRYSPVTLHQELIDVELGSAERVIY